MDSDGSLTLSRSQSGFARNDYDGIGQGSASDGLAILGETEAAPKPDALRFAALAQPAPLPRADVLLGIKATALRYASHPGLCHAGLSVTDWLALYRANIEVESAYRQDVVSRAGAIGLGQLIPATARDLDVEGESIRSIIAGDTEDFEIDGVPGGQAFAIKPVARGVHNNVTVYMNRRSYYFNVQETHSPTFYLVQFRCPEAIPLNLLTFAKWFSTRWRHFQVSAS